MLQFVTVFHQENNKIPKLTAEEKQNNPSIEGIYKKKFLR